MKRFSLYLLISILTCMLLHKQALALDEIATAATGTPAESTPPQPVDPLQQGMEAFYQGSYEEAEESFKKARSANPGSALAAYYLGSTMKKMQNHGEAIIHLKDAVTLQPPVREAFVELADAYYVMDKTDEALHALQVADSLGVEPAQTMFLKGLILFKKKQYGDAISAFESAKSFDVKLASPADYQIAMIHVRTGKFTEAVDLFNRLVAKEPGSDIAAMAQEQVDSITAIEKKASKRFNATAGVSYQHDSNVILKPNNVAVTNVSGQSDTAAVVTINADYALVRNASYDVKAQYSLYSSMYSELKSYDVQSHVLGFGADFPFARKSLNMLVHYNYTLVDDEKYMNTITLSPTLGFDLEKGRLLLSLLYQAKDYNGTPFTPEENRDGSNIGAGAGWFGIFSSGRGAFSVRYDVNKEDTEGANWSYLGNKAGAAVQYTFTEKLKTAGNLELNSQAFDNLHSVLSQKRKDTVFTAGVQLGYSILRNVDAQVFYSHTKADSTLAVYDYTKNLAGIGLLATF